jgi:hypothetical protein
MKQSMQILTSSESNEWYTPPEIISLVKEALGEIDLDPASNAVANQVIGAKKYFSERGLELTWQGSVFCNPPYGTGGMQGKFLAKALSEYMQTNISQCIILTKSVPGYLWWDDMFHVNWMGDICITYDRISFYKPEWYHNGKIIYPKNSKSKTASTFWYLGSQPELFEKVFSRLGMVLNTQLGSITEYNNGRN